jgi:hypothetical protein
MNRCLTTLIDLKLNHAELNKKFRLYKVSLTRKTGKPNYAAELTKIDYHAAPVALVRHSRSYWILIPASTTKPAGADDIAYQSIAFEDCDGLMLGRLLIRALGKLGAEAFFSGLGESYLYVDSEAFFDHPIYKCVAFDLCESLRFGAKFVALKGQTFSPAELFVHNDIGITLPDKKRFFETLSYVIDMSGNKSQVCTIVHEGIAAVPDVAELFTILEKLEEGQQQGMERAFIEKELSGTGEISEVLAKKLLKMLNTYPKKTPFFKGDFKETGVTYRSNAEKGFFDRYYEQSGILLYYSLKGQHNEYLTALTGHFYNAEHSAFFAGIEKGGFKFSRGQFNHIRYLEGPEALKQRCLAMTEAYYVRNKQATVLPFPFKNLAQSRENANQYS